MTKSELLKINEKLKDENEKLLNEMKELKEENVSLNKELFEIKKKFSNLNISAINEKGINSPINEINYLNEIIKMKDKEIKYLNIQLKNIGNNEKFVDYNKIMVVNFISLDQNVNCGIKCLETDTFAEVEEKLYQQYEGYRETNNNFISKGKLILRFKTIGENNIKNGDKIQLIKII